MAFMSVDEFWGTPAWQWPLFTEESKNKADTPDDDTDKAEGVNGHEDSCEGISSGENGIGVLESWDMGT